MATVSKQQGEPVTVDWSKRIISDEKIPFDTGLAEYYLSIPAFQDIERDISTDHVEHLTRAMDSGQFLSVQAIMSIAVCEWDGKERKLNGQHISWARSYYSKKQYKPEIRVVRYKVMTEDEYRLLYANFDRNRVRTPSHLAKMALFGTPEYAGVNKTTIPYLVSGARFWRFNASGRVKADEVYKALRYEFPEIGKLTAELVTYAKSNKQYHLERSPVVAAMMETLRASKQKSMEFWTRLADGLFDNKTDPIKILSDYLHTHSVGSRSAAGSTMLTSGDEMYNVCVACFNAARAGITLTKTPPGKRSQRLAAR